MGYFSQKSAEIMDLYDQGFSVYFISTVTGIPADDVLAVIYQGQSLVAQEQEHDQFISDAEADADVLASAGWGTDEDYYPDADMAYEDRYEIEY